MRTLSASKTLLYYDEPQLFIANDQLGTPYVCFWVDREDDVEKYLCVPTSRGRLDDFISGSIDLLSIVRSSETGELFVCSAADGNIDSMPAVLIPECEIPARWLPAADFFIKPVPATGELVIQESRDRQRAIIHFSLSPPEARDQPKIVADSLAQAVRIIQRVITHAYRKALRDLDENARNAIDRPEIYRLEVFAFSPGSFTLHMQTAAPADMLGYSHVEKALRVIDMITEHIDSPTAVVQSIAGYGGHFATAYRDLLQFIVQNKTPLSYEWSMPERVETTTRRISDRQAEPVYHALLEKAELLVEKKLLTGIVTKADRNYGTWRLLAEEDNKEHAGQSDPHRIDLSGLEIGARFEFQCEERLVEERGTGRESTILHLKSFHRLS